MMSRLRCLSAFNFRRYAPPENDCEMKPDLYHVKIRCWGGKVNRKLQGTGTDGRVIPRPSHVPCGGFGAWYNDGEVIDGCTAAV